MAILGAIYAASITSSLESAGVSGAAPTDTSGLTPAALRDLPAAAQELFKSAVVDGTQAIFLVGAIIAVAGIVLSWLVKQVPLRDSMSERTPSAVEAAETVEQTIV